MSPASVRRRLSRSMYREDFSPRAVGPDAYWNAFLNGTNALDVHLLPAEPGVGDVQDDTLLQAVSGSRCACARARPTSSIPGPVEG